MSNGFEININEADFKAKTQEDQTWVLFQGVVQANKSILHIDEEGCEFAKQKHKSNLRWVASAITGTAIVALGAVWIVYQLVCGK